MTTVKTHIGSLADMGKRFIDAWNNAEAGQEVNERHISTHMHTTPQPWVDPDDAPELTDEMLDKGVWMIGGREVSRDEGEAAMRDLVKPRSPE